MKRLGEPTKEMYTLLDSILDGTTARGLIARNKVENFAAEHGDLIKLVINKDLRCGVSAALFNSVHLGSIDQFKVQLAKEVPVIDLKYPMLAQLKYDGVRLIALNKGGCVTFYTRNGNEVNLPSLKAILEDAPFTNYAMDGEITLVTGKQEDRTKISGMINSAMHGGIIDESNVRFNAFDFMALSDWEAAKCNELYSMRFKALNEILSYMRSENFIPATTVTLANAEDANEYYQEVLEEGYEGLVLKSENHLYSFKRSKDWVKVKETKEADLKCIGWNEGTGKLQGLIGALICKGTVEDKEVYVKVAGLTMMAACADPEINYVGHTIEVKYNAVIQDSITDEYSLFLPRFSRVRFDK